MGIICDENKQLTKPGYQKTTNIVNVEINKNYTLPSKEYDNNYNYENADEAPIITVTDDSSGYNNYILGEIEINEDLVNKDVRIINSYEAFERSNRVKTFDEKKRNEINIRKCKIFIEGKLIPFSYMYKFDKIGTFKIKYSFQSNLKSLYALFCECYIKKLDFSNFNTKNATSMEYMFYYCSSLKDLNINNFNTENVTNMQNMFCRCEQLKELNLSSFNTNNVTNMQYMFYCCYQLTNLDLSNFKTQKKTKVNGMFKSCNCLTKSLLICYDEKILSA